MSNSGQYVSIIEQPAGNLQRFRYFSEVDGTRSVGSIPGVNSVPPDRKTYPTIRVHGHQGPFLVLLSLLNPHNNMVHPHSITGSESRYQCNNGVIYVIIADASDVVFKNIGILCVKGKTEADVNKALNIRMKMGIDPFRAGFGHLKNHRLIDFTAVRLCFQVFLPGKDWTSADLNNPKKYTRSLPPVASDVVYDAKKHNELKIVYINSCAGPVTGGNEMTLLCDKYTGSNPEVVFENGRGWVQTAAVKMYHKQLAIVFEAPPYGQDPNCTDLKVMVYLRQSGDRGEHRSQPATVEYLLPDPTGSPLKYPTRPLLEKSSVSLKHVRIQQRSCRGGDSPDEARLKRWRPWRAAPLDAATDSEEDRFILQANKLDVTSMTQNDVDERADAIPLFDPQKSELCAHEWISKIEELGAIHNWSDTVKSYYMQTKLSGNAKVWLSSLRDIDNMTWLDWKDKLLEAFPRNRKIDYVELLKQMLEENTRTRAQLLYYYNKNALHARHEMNAKKAYACLIEGLPLQMKPSYYESCETPDFIHPKYHPDIDQYRINIPQMQPNNLNIADYKYDTHGQEDERRTCCCRNVEKPNVIRHCPSNRLNEIRPTCIQRNHTRPILEKSWHRPCSTLTSTSSSSSPSTAHPAPDWFTDQNSTVPGNHSV